MAFIKQAISMRPVCLIFIVSIIMRVCLSSCYLLVPPIPNLQYHRGPLLAGDEAIKLCVTFYGDFTLSEKNTIRSFLNSLGGDSVPPLTDNFPSSALRNGGVSAERKELSLLQQQRSGLNPSGFLSLQRKASGSPSSSRKTAGFSSIKLKSTALSSLSARSSLHENRPAARSVSAFSDPQARGSSPPHEEEQLSGSSSEQRKGGSSLSGEQTSGFPSSSSSKQKGSESVPAVADWWSVTRAYTDSHGKPVSQAVLLERELSDDYSLGTHLSRDAITLLAQRSAMAASASDSPLRIHVILTAADVAVEGFCMHACGGHGHVQTDKTVYAWVGNARMQCPGYCAWPFVQAEYGPATMDPLLPPNGGAGADGMITNLAKLLVEAATNPYGNGYHAGAHPHDDGVGAGGVCTGVYGDGAFPGYPGHAYTDAFTGASFNVMGSKGSKFLLPYIWNLPTLSCAVRP